MYITLFDKNKIQNSEDLFASFVCFAVRHPRSYNLLPNAKNTKLEVRYHEKSPYHSHLWYGLFLHIAYKFYLDAVFAVVAVLVSSPRT